MASTTWDGLAAVQLLQGQSYGADDIPAAAAHLQAPAQQLGVRYARAGLVNGAQAHAHWGAPAATSQSLFLEP